MKLTRIKGAQASVGVPACRGLSPAFLRAGPLHALVSRLHARRIDPARALSESGLGAALPSDPDALVPYLQASALFTACVRLTGEQHFGLLSGASLGLSALGLPGELARHSPTVEVALRAIADHFSLHDQGGTVVVHVRDGVASLGYAVHEPGAQALDQVADFALAISFGLMRDLCGPDWSPSLVRFAHRRPADVGPYSELFCCRLEFDAAEDSLLFAANWLALPAVGADPLRRDALALRASAGERDDRRPWTRRIRATLRAGLAIRECSIAQVSAATGMNYRTLERRLHEEGTTFTALLDRVRQEVAIQLLENTRLPMTEIAEALGFADPTVFARVFRRWRGMAPSTWRAQRATART